MSFAAIPKRKLRLGVNIDHVATVRNARGSSYPDPVRAAIVAQKAGADGITAHLREDRRHISDEDIRKIHNSINIPLNFEMAATSEMLDIALETKPFAVCLVPEKREERTTEGGLDAASGHNHLAPMIRQLGESGSRVSLFIEANEIQLRAAVSLGAPVVELHTGTYCDAFSGNNQILARSELKRYQEMARLGSELGLEVHAGHGMTFDNVKPIAEIPELVELNIGHFLIGEAIFTGLEDAILKMRNLMDEARGFEVDPVL